MRHTSVRRLLSRRVLTDYLNDFVELLPDVEIAVIDSAGKVVVEAISSTDDSVLEEDAGWNYTQPLNIDGQEAGTLRARGRGLSGRRRSSRRADPGGAVEGRYEWTSQPRDSCGAPKGIDGGRRSGSVGSAVFGASGQPGGSPGSRVPPRTRPETSGKLAIAGLRSARARHLQPSLEMLPRTRAACSAAVRFSPRLPAGAPPSRRGSIGSCP